MYDAPTALHQHVTSHETGNRPIHFTRCYIHITHIETPMSGFIRSSRCQGLRTCCSPHGSRWNSNSASCRRFSDEDDYGNGGGGEYIIIMILRTLMILIMAVTRNVVMLVSMAVTMIMITIAISICPCDYAFSCL